MTKILKWGGVNPSDLYNIDYDKIIVTSSKYFDEIFKCLVEEYNVDPIKILSIEDILGDFRNPIIRDKWVIEKVKEIPADSVILDAGAGEQKYRPYCSHLKYISQDFGEYVPQDNEAGIHGDKWNYDGLDIKCDIICIPLPDDSVDAILCTEVFEHIKDPMLALKEFSRILKPGGRLLLSAPFCCLTHMAPFFFYNGFSEYWYNEFLHESGFNNISVFKYGNFFAWIQQELLRVNEMCARYSLGELSFEEEAAIFETIKILGKYSKYDRGSKETLCFGMLVAATRE